MLAAGMMSPSGRCQTLDAAADGYVRAEAGGLLLLRSVTSIEVRQAVVAGGALFLGRVG